MRIFLTITFVITLFCQNSFSSQSNVNLLYKSLFYNNIPEYSADNIKVSENLLPRLKEYQKRTNQFKSLIKSPASPEGQMGYSKILRIEKGIYSLIQVEGINEIAASYAKSAKIFMEWEGMSDGPLEEARFAETFLADNPDTLIKPYLILFLIHRYRIAFECLGYEKKAEEQIAASTKYQHFLALARESTDPLVKEIAESIDQEKFLYMKTDRHP